MREVTGAEEMAGLCAALSHEKRVQFYRILQENGDMTLTDLFTLAIKSLPGRLTYVQVRYHIELMERSGVVRLGKKDGQFYVWLLKKNLRLLTDDDAPKAEEPQITTNNP
ncbi:MAG: helix-turn-helix transcriptional regulator [Euryarchaeota archaeon]|nr:helix-turn-helix transcriptional regulator [Euryarchaeota archaeon]